MAKILVLYYSMYGHIETLAQAVAEGARNDPGVEVTLKRVPETMDPEVFKAAHGKTGQQAAVASPGEYDAIIFGTPTRFGNMAGQMRTFLDQTGGLWAKGALVGRLLAFLLQLVRGAVKNRRSPPPGRPWRITAWLSSRLAIAIRHFSIFLKVAAAHLTVPQPLPVLTVLANPMPAKQASLDTKVSMWPRSPQNWLRLE
jgi:hypothetical protein